MKKSVRSFNNIYVIKTSILYLRPLTNLRTCPHIPRSGILIKAPHLIDANIIYYLTLYASCFVNSCSPVDKCFSDIRFRFANILLRSFRITDIVASMILFIGEHLSVGSGNLCSKYCLIPYDELQFDSIFLLFFLIKIH